MPSKRRSKMPRTAEIARQTKETDIKVSINLDGKGENNIDTGIGFFDHMLTALSKHSGIDMNISCKGDLQVDAHLSFWARLSMKLSAIRPASDVTAQLPSRWMRHWERAHLISQAGHILFSIVT